MKHDSPNRCINFTFLWCILISFENININSIDLGKEKVFIIILKYFSYATCTDITKRQNFAFWSC